MVSSKVAPIPGVPDAKETKDLDPSQPAPAIPTASALEPVDLSSRANQLPPIVQAASIGLPTETEVSMKAMMQYDNYIDDDAEGCTCGTIPVAMVQGTNRLWCGRRCIYGNDLSYFISAQLLMLVPVVCVVYGLFKEDKGLELGITPIVLALLMESFIWTTACLDPGRKKFSNESLSRCDRFCQIFVQIGAI